MRLRKLQAQFYKRVVDAEGRVFHRAMWYLKDADGVGFLCPLCYLRNDGEHGIHRVLCWFAGKVPDDATPGPGRWQPSGTGLDDLTFVPYPGHGLVSVQLTSGCMWHGHVRNGEATLQ